MNNQTDFLSAIETRKSRRSYTTEPIAPAKIAYLQKKIQKFNMEGGLSLAWLENGGKAFTALKSYGMFKNVESIIILKGSRSTSDLFERIGYYGELLVLEATALELGSCWIAGTYDKKSDLFPLENDEELVSILSIGNVPPEQTLKEKFVYRTIRRKSIPLEKLYTAESEVPQWFISGMKAVQKAPSAINSQRVRFHYSETGVTASVPGTRTTDPIDLGIAKLHFALAAEGNFSFGNEAVFIK
ncbi:nitroreductase family protein [Sphaerochaeta pleomorpha str. Grapes]|uniref:Nitroreductase family protein n=1 Tax=Sphaerochaeta pleomorpha (strain ATCC BAA-1885 / DSM 22778 / Grapes) TaxID=158190 RepID=G8QSD1_SPHPG|nr:nitroreductase family protein [Sphaerochaeta pleomorpha]AEV30061.1 nitroreductase family protein [Sphaerochaeta pleomorpha str. Grapes]